MIKLDDKMLILYILNHLDSPEVLAYAERENRSILDDIKKRLKQDIKKDQDLIGKVSAQMIGIRH
jgi:hypothetical protein